MKAESNIFLAILFKKEVLDMATSSITKNFVVSGKEQVEMFANAIEESYQESLKRHNNPTSLKYRELKGPDEIKEFMKKWKKAHE